MKKRLLTREVALLMVPVLAVGGWGWWLSQRALQQDKVTLQFEIDKPRTLERFWGYEGAFLVSAQDGRGREYDFISADPYLELQTPKGVLISRIRNGDGPKGFWREVWNSNQENRRFEFRLRQLPPGQLSFGFDGLAQPRTESGITSTVATPSAAVRVSGKWKVDRDRLQPPNLATLPPSPWEVRSVTVAQVNISKSKKPGNLNQVILEMVYGLRNTALPQKPVLQYSMSAQRVDSRQQSHSDRIGMSPYDVRDTRDRSVKRFGISLEPDIITQEIRVGGRVTSEDRRPLRFGVEPFRFQTVKVGQKLRFKSYPVDLPTQ